mgnify:CR=1 FL=1
MENSNQMTMTDEMNIIIKYKKDLFVNNIKEINCLEKLSFQYSHNSLLSLNDRQDPIQLQELDHQVELIVLFHFLRHSAIRPRTSSHQPYFFKFNSFISKY